MNFCCCCAEFSGIRILNWRFAPFLMFVANDALNITEHFRTNLCYRGNETLAKLKQVVGLECVYDCEILVEA